MKKTILAFALAAMSLTALDGMAQTSAAPAPKQEKTADKKACKERRHAAVNPFEGMNLTDAQKSSLKQLDEKRKTERKAQAQASTQKKQEMKAERRAKRQAARKAYLEEVKAIVGPENYVVFLENMYVNAGGHGHGKSKASLGHHGKDGKHKARRGHHARNAHKGAYKAGNNAAEASKS